jgi:two-component system, OmpR family, alkaline phosphatase synthesis response regulator PhoP
VKPRILVVDDEPEAVELVEFNLKQAGYAVITAADGAEALEKGARADAGPDRARRDAAGDGRV